MTSTRLSTDVPGSTGDPADPLGPLLSLNVRLWTDLFRSGDPERLVRPFQGQVLASEGPVTRTVGTVGGYVLHSTRDAHRSELVEAADEQGGEVARAVAELMSFDGGLRPEVRQQQQGTAEAVAIVELLRLEPDIGLGGVEHELIYRLRRLLVGHGAVVAQPTSGKRRWEKAGFHPIEGSELLLWRGNGSLVA